MSRYYAEGDLIAMTVYKEVTPGAFQSRIDSNKTVLEGTDEEIDAMVKKLRNLGMYINIVEQ